MGLYLSFEFIFIISVVLTFISMHSLVLCIIDYHRYKNFISLLFLMIGLYIFYGRSCACIKSL